MIIDKATGDKSLNENYFTWELVDYSSEIVVFYIFTGSIAIITGFFIIPLIILVYVQIGNFTMGKTMLERYSKSA